MDSFFGALHRAPSQASEVFSSGLDYGVAVALVSFSAEGSHNG